jgi:hypothetical protein
MHHHLAVMEFTALDLGLDTLGGKKKKTGVA